MSIIQDALRRKEQEEQPEETGKKKALSISNSTMHQDQESDKRNAPSIHPVPEESKQAPIQKQAKSKILSTFLIITVFVAIAVTAVWYLVSRAVSSVTKGTIEEKVAPAVESSKPVVAPSTVPPLEEKVILPSVAPSTLATSLSETEEEKSVAPAEKLPGVPAETGAMKAKTSDSAESIQTEKEKAKVSAVSIENLPAVQVPPAQSVSFDWPHLTLTAVLIGPQGEQIAARINKKMVSVGTQIEGVILVKIQSDGVVLKHGEDTRFLRMGATLY